MRLNVGRARVARGRSHDLTFRRGGGESDEGCRRRSKTKYEIGTTPAQLTSATAAPHTRLRPGIRLAGRRLMSMGAATRRARSGYGRSGRQPAGPLAQIAPPSWA